MEYISAEDVSWVPAPADNFTGRVWFGPVSRSDDRTLSVLGVSFDPGARTDWHTHPDGQVLYVVAGSGKVGTADGEVVTIGPGDTVYAPPGEEHWHGASAASPMTHLSLTTGGETAWLPRKVTEEEYAGD